MKYYLYSALLLLSALGSPVGAQMLLDAAAGAAIQSSLQSTGSGNALQLLQDAKYLRNQATQSPLLPAQVQLNSQSSNSTIVKRAPASVIQGASVLFSVNGHGIQLCSSGLPCFWQLRRSMGLN